MIDRNAAAVRQGPIAESWAAQIAREIEVFADGLSAEERQAWGDRLHADLLALGARGVPVSRACLRKLRRKGGLADGKRTRSAHGAVRRVGRCRSGLLL